MKHTSFFIRKNRIENGFAPLCMRITVCSQEAILTLEKIRVALWDGKGQRVKGTSKEAQSLNDLIETKTHLVRSYVNDLNMQKKAFDAALLRDMVTGRYQAEQRVQEEMKAAKGTILKAFDDCAEFKKVGEDAIKEGTIRQYAGYRGHIAAFIKSEFNAEDLPLEMINLEFIEKFFTYLSKPELALGHNRRVKIVRTLKYNVVQYGIAHDVITKNPFFHFKKKYVPRKEFQSTLTEDQLQLIVNLHIEPSLNSLCVAKDIFLGMSYSGLSIGDFERLSSRHIVIDSDGDRWLVINRKKSGVESTIPIGTALQELIDKYKNDRFCINHKVLFPTVNLEVLNRTLKVIGAMAGLPQNIVLSTKVARKAFACIGEENGVPVESMSRMMGHSDTRMMKEYNGFAKKKRIKSDVQGTSLLKAV